MDSSHLAVACESTDGYWGAAWLFFCAAASACYSWKKLFFLCFQMLEQEEKDNEAVSKMMALDQKNQLLNLFHEKNRPVLAKWPQVDSSWQRCCRSVMLWGKEQTAIVMVTLPRLRRAPTCSTSFLCFLWTSGKSSSGAFGQAPPPDGVDSDWLFLRSVCCAGGRRNRPPCLTWATLCCCVHTGASCSPMTPWSTETRSSEFAWIQPIKHGVRDGPLNCRGAAVGSLRFDEMLCVGQLGESDRCVFFEMDASVAHLLCLTRTGLSCSV